MELLQVKILTPNQVIYDAKAKAVSSKNTLGPFDVLPEHANFITLVQNSPIVVTLEDGKTLKFNFPLAILYNNQNVVKIYTDILAQPNVRIA